MLANIDLDNDASGVSATASMSARKLSQGTSAAIASSGSPFFESAANRAAAARARPQLAARTGAAGVAALTAFVMRKTESLQKLVEENYSELAGDPFRG